MNLRPEGSLFQSPALFSLVLAFALLGMVVVLNLVGSSEIPISVGQFQELESKDLLARIEITSNGLRCLLRKRVWLASGGRELVGEKVFLEERSGISPEVINQWKASGIVVVFHDKGQTFWGESMGIGLVVFLLGVGIWYLWAQIQKDRHGIGSPRRRLQKLEQDFREGKIGAEEYRTGREAIWGEM